MILLVLRAVPRGVAPGRSGSGPSFYGGQELGTGGVRDPLLLEFLLSRNYHEHDGLGRNYSIFTSRVKVP